MMLNWLFCRLIGHDWDLFFFNALTAERCRRCGRMRKIEVQGWSKPREDG